MKRKAIVALVAVITGVFFATSALALEFGARAYYWFPKFSGTEASQGTEINMDDLLAMGTESMPMVEAYFGIGKHHLSLMFTPLNYKGDANLAATPVIYKGVTFNGKVHSEFKSSMFDLDYQYDLINLKNILAGFAVGPVLKVKVVDGSLELTQTGLERKDSYTVPIPMIGLGANIGILANILQARAKVTGMSYSDDYAWDAMADVSLTPFPFTAIYGGWRYLKVKYDQKDTYLNMQFNGPYVGLSVGW